MSPETQNALNAADIARLKKDVVDLRADMETAEKRLNALERFAQWAIGAAAAVGVVAGLFADTLKHKLGLT